MKRIKKLIGMGLVASMVVGQLPVAKINAEDEKLAISASSASLQVTGTKKLKVSGEYKKLTWSSENEAVARVEKNGKVTAISKGSTVVHAVSESGEDVSCKVKVIDKKIRVIIKTTGHASIFHQSVKLTSTEPFVISNGSTSKTYKAKKEITITQGNELLKKNGEITINAENSGRIQIKSITRSQGNPSYRGTMQIKYIKGSGLVVVNTVSLEQYLYSVVSSEMSPSYPQEALKTQAIAARSYAYSHLNSENYKKYGADLDDSTMYQVYNNCSEASNVEKAVKATANQVMKEGDTIKSTYYFATSYGRTSLPSEVWGGSSEDKFYNSVVQIAKGTAKDLSKNSKFNSFLADEKIKVFDRNSEWYRWTARVSKEKMQKKINEKLSVCCLSYPKDMLKLQSDGNYKAQAVYSIGKLKGISVVDREASGMVRGIKIVGSEATIQVNNSTAIKILLAPTYGVLDRKNSSSLSGLSSLPSSYFKIAKVGSGSAISYEITGGGYGHNVGMSQTGAKQMAQDGYKCEEILAHYYNQIKVGNVAK